MGTRYTAFHAALLFFVITTATLFGNTWYVDPVNGSLDYTGKSPFKVPFSNEGPLKDIQQVVWLANEFDIVVLMDGVYAGWRNTAPHIFSDIDFKHLYVISAYGPENCKIILDDPITFGNNSYYEETATVFSGITFTSDTLWMFRPEPYIVISNSNITFEKCVFSGFYNHDNYPILEISSAHPLIKNCTFKDNHTPNIIDCQNSSLIIEDAIFTENEITTESNYQLAIVKSHYESDVRFKNCTFTQNTSKSCYAAISCEDCDFLWVENCSINDNFVNTESTFTGIYFSNVDSVIIAKTQVSNDPGQSMGSFGICAQYPKNFNMYECDLNYNSCGIGINAEDFSNVEISNCNFIGNHYCLGNSSGIELNVRGDGAKIEIHDCAIQRNSEGIVEYSVNNGTITINNCVITDNEFSSIKSIPPCEANKYIKNCTFANNGNEEPGSFNTIFTNCILRRIHETLSITSNVTINYCNIEGGWTGPGEGNIDVDPLFVDGGVWYYDAEFRVPGTDYHLKSTAGRLDDENGMLVQDDADSPCIDAGDPDDVPFFEPYGSGGRVDMGAYGNTHEASFTYRCDGGYRGSGMMFSDINKDCLVNLADYAIMAGEWLDSTMQDEPM